MDSGLRGGNKTHAHLGKATEFAARDGRCSVVANPNSSQILCFISPYSFSLEMQSDEYLPLNRLGAIGT